MQKSNPIKQATPKSNGIKKQLIWFAAGVIVCGGIILGIQRFAKAKPSLEMQLLLLSNDGNKNSPYMIDEGTRFDNTVIVPGNIFQFRYTLIYVDRQQGVDTVALKNFILPNVISNIKTSTQLKFQRDNKITMSYYYKDGRGDYVCSFLVTPEQYNAKVEKSKGAKTK